MVISSKMNMIREIIIRNFLFSIGIIPLIPPLSSNFLLTCHRTFSKDME